MQIIHFGQDYGQLSFSELNLVSTTIFMPGYDKKAENYPAMNILNSRVSPVCRLSFILFPNNNPRTSRRFAKYITIAADNHLFYLRNFDPKYKLVSNTNEIINLIFSTTNEVPQSPYPARLLLFHYLYIIIATPFALCLPRLEYYEKTFSNMTCLSEIYFSPGNNFLKMVDQLWIRREEWYSLYFSKSLNNRTESNLLQLTLDIFSARNLTLIRDYYSYSKKIKMFNAAQPPSDTDVFLIITENEGYQFLTCYTVPYITFYFYFTPFQPELWGMLRITIAVIRAVATAVYHFRTDCRQPFSVWLFVLATLFEEGAFIPSKIEKITFFRIAFGIWSIMSVILTNGYTQNKT